MVLYRVVREKTTVPKLISLFQETEMPTPHQIQIRFIRQVRGSCADPHRDDILTITRQGDNSMRLVYTEKSEDEPIIDVMNYTHHQTMAYMYRVLWLLTMDNDPFASVQFFLPGYPTFLITTAAIMNNSSQILDIIFSVCLSWPAAGTRLDAARTSTHTIYAP
jgi:hypothetical protein